MYKVRLRCWTCSGNGRRWVDHTMQAKEFCTVCQGRGFTPQESHKHTVRRARCYRFKLITGRR